MAPAQGVSLTAAWKTSLCRKDFEDSGDRTLDTQWSHRPDPRPVSSVRNWPGRPGPQALPARVIWSQRVDVGLDQGKRPTESSAKVIVGLTETQGGPSDEPGA
jgi:hypothetical protein